MARLSRLDSQTGGENVFEVGAEMRRTMQAILIPVFQFGIFSENNQSFFAGMAVLSIDSLFTGLSLRTTQLPDALRWLWRDYPR